MKKFFVLMMVLILTVVSVSAQWQEYEEVDMMTDAMLFALYQHAETSTNTVTAPLFVFRWSKEGVFEILIGWGGWPMLMKNGLIRYGSNPAVPIEVIGLSDDFGSTYFGNPDELLAKIRSLPSSEYITVACTTVAGVQSVAKFKVGDLQIMLMKNKK